MAEEWKSFLSSDQSIFLMFQKPCGFRFLRAFDKQTALLSEVYNTATGYTADPHLWFAGRYLDTHGGRLVDALRGNADSCEWLAVHPDMPPLCAYPIHIASC
jgi:hypothetical protein